MSDPSIDVTQAVVVSGVSPDASQAFARLALFNEDGTELSLSGGSGSGLDLVAAGVELAPTDVFDTSSSLVKPGLSWAWEGGAPTTSRVEIRGHMLSFTRYATLRFTGDDISDYSFYGVMLYLPPIWIGPGQDIDYFQAPLGTIPVTLTLHGSDDAIKQVDPAAKVNLMAYHGTLAVTLAGDNLTGVAAGDYLVADLKASSVFLPSGGDVESASLVRVGPMHPGASSLSTPAEIFDTPRSITSLEVIGGSIFAGYGDYNVNTGPTTIESVPVSAPTDPWTSLLVADSEQILAYRQIADGRILAPHVDPLGSGGGYSERSVGGAWTDKPNAIASDGPEHVFDMIEFAGSIWACGSAHTVPPSGDLSNAIVWRSTDGGATWEESFRDTVATSYSRFYYLALAGSSMYVKNEAGGCHKWTAVGGWETAGDILPASGASGKAWGDGWVLPDQVALNNNLMSLSAFDGSSSTVVISAARAWNVGPDDALYYLLDADSKIYKLTSPVATPTEVSAASGLGAGYALAVLSESLAVVGTSDSRILTVALAT